MKYNNEQNENFVTMAFGPLLLHDSQPTCPCLDEILSGYVSRRAVQSFNVNTERRTDQDCKNMSV